VLDNVAARGLTAEQAPSLTGGNHMAIFDQQAAIFKILVAAVTGGCRVIKKMQHGAAV
jgi:hypothetical protein